MTHPHIIIRETHEILAFTFTQGTVRIEERAPYWWSARLTVNRDTHWWEGVDYSPSGAVDRLCSIIIHDWDKDEKAFRKALGA